MNKLILMRGLSGSGKSTKAESFGGKVFSTDDFFMVDGEYQFDFSVIAQAHQWNELRTFNAMENGTPVVVVDNTNTQFWQMKSYVKKAIELGYEIEFALPETPWAWDVAELTKRKSHGVPEEVISKTLYWFEKDATVEKVLQSINPF